VWPIAKASSTMHRFSLMIALLVASCSKSPTQQGSPEPGASQQPAPSAASPSAAAVSAASPSAAAPGAWYVGTWKGDFAVARHNSATTTKEGAPAAWEKDAGQALTGGATAEVTIDARGEASGSVKGALGDLGLVGKIDDATLRASLVARGDDPKTIQNGYLVLRRDAEVLKGHLDAASGDALVLRHAEVALKRAEP
jgi:hypothetical protein